MVDMICPVDSQSITLSDLTKPNKRHISGNYLYHQLYCSSSP
jgi:hypothetical protein